MCISYIKYNDSNNKIVRVVIVTLCKYLNNMPPKRAVHIEDKPIQNACSVYELCHDH